MSDKSELKILRIATDLYPDVLGGGALHAHEMSKMQSEMGHEVVVLTSDHGDSHLPRRETKQGYEIRRYNEVARPFGNSITPRMLGDLRNLMKSSDIIHAHSHLYLSTNLISLLQYVSEVPLAVTNHGLYSQSAPTWFQNIFLNSVGKFTFNQADCVFCYTDTDKQRVRELGVDSKISVVNNGIDCNTFSKNGQESEENRILFVGRLNKNKGPQRLIKAFENICTNFPEYTLKIIGEGPLEDELLQQIQDANLESKVEMEGRVPNEKLPSIYAQSSVFVLPSLNEGLPRTVLESLACETPVIATSLSQLEQVMEGVGYTIPPKSVAKLEEALTKLLSSEDLREEYGKKGRTKVLKNYSWKNTVEQTTEEYYNLID